MPVIEQYRFLDATWSNFLCSRGFASRRRTPQASAPAPRLDCFARAAGALRRICVPCTGGPTGQAGDLSNSRDILFLMSASFNRVSGSVNILNGVLSAIEDKQREINTVKHTNRTHALRKIIRPGFLDNMGSETAERCVYYVKTDPDQISRIPQSTRLLIMISSMFWGASDRLLTSRRVLHTQGIFQTVAIQSYILETLQW